MAITVESILNQALRRIGYEQPIGTIWEGSRASRVALEIYGQTRDVLLGGKDWIFARQTVPLVLLKTAPVSGYAGNPWTTAYPPLPWIFEYAYPDACIQMRSVRPTPYVIPEFMPQPYPFVLGNDTASGARVVLTNLINAQAVITGQITNPAAMDQGFIDALIDALATRLQEALSPDDAAVRLRIAEAAAAEANADTRRG